MGLGRSRCVRARVRLGEPIRLRRGEQMFPEHVLSLMRALAQLSSTVDMALTSTQMSTCTPAFSVRFVKDNSLPF